MFEKTKTRTTAMTETMFDYISNTDKVPGSSRSKKIAGLVIKDYLDISFDDCSSFLKLTKNIARRSLDSQLFDEYIATGNFMLRHKIRSVRYTTTSEVFLVIVDTQTQKKMRVVFDVYSDDIRFSHTAHDGYITDEEYAMPFFKQILVAHRPKRLKNTKRLHLLDSWIAQSK